MLRSNSLRLLLIAGAGVLTPILMNVIPIASGGSSLIFVLTVPVTIGISLMMLTYFILRKAYNWNQEVFDITLTIFTIISIFISIQMFPYK